MAFNFMVDSLLDGNQIDRIYLSIDEDSGSMEWLDKIYRYNLGGYHILAGEGFQKNLKRKLNMGSKPFILPRYLWFKDGQFIVKHAAPPSAQNAFRKELLEVLQ